MPDGTLRVKVVGDVTDAQSKMRDLGGSFGQVGDIAQKLGSSGFAAMTRGAEEMDRAQGDFMAATGRSRTEAVAFGHDMDGLVGNAGAVGRSFEEIATVGTTVAQQFGITGDKAAELTGKILEFAQVTHSDANVTAGQLEDTLTALGLSADDATGFMDTLVASSQKYGTDVGPEMLGTLQQMAPAMDILGASAGDAVGLLNAMEKAGVPATGAVKDLVAVVKNFPPGTTLDDVVAKLGAVEDPAARGRLAVELLGAKAGPGLAKIIEPGMTSLDDFGISADDAAGALDTAAGDMQTTQDKIKGVFEKLTAGAREVGTEFGPALTGLNAVSNLAGPLVTNFAGLIKNVAAKLLPPAVAAGAARGIASGEAEAVAATGPGILSSFLAKFGLMTGAKVAAAATAGAAAGAAEGEAEAAAMAAKAGAGLAGSGAAAAAGGGALAFGGTIGAVVGAAAGLAFLPAILDKITGQDTASRIANAGQTVAAQLGVSWSQADQSAYAAAWAAGVQESLDSRSLWDKIMQNGNAAAVQAGQDSANAYAESHGLALPDAMRDAIQTPAYQSFRAEERAGWVATGADSAAALAEGVSAHEEDVARGYALMADAVRREWIANDLQKFTELGAQSVDQVAQGALSESSVLTDGAAALAKLLAEGLTPEQVAMQAIGADYAKGLEAGLSSEVIGAQDTARDLAAKAIGAIANAGLTGANGQKGLEAQGRYYVDLLNSGMTASEARALLAGSGVGASVIDGLEQQYAPATTAGSTLTSHVATGSTSPAALSGVNAAGGRVGDAWIAGLASHIASERAENDIAYAANQATAPLRGHSPPTVGPLREIGTWGGNVAQAWIDAFRNRIAYGGALLSSAMSSIVSPDNPIAQLGRPFAFATTGPSAGGVAVGQPPITVHAYGFQADDVERQLVRAQRRTATLAQLETRTNG